MSKRRPRQNLFESASAPAQSAAAEEILSSTEIESKMLAQKWLRGDSSAVAKAFLTMEQMTHKNRKLTKSEWESEWNTFLNKVR